MIRLAMIAAAGLALSACGEEEVDLDTEYEESLPSPVPEGGEGDAPVPDQTSMEGGPDDQVDQIVADEYGAGADDEAE